MARIFSAMMAIFAVASYAAKVQKNGYAAATKEEPAAKTSTEVNAVGLSAAEGEAKQGMAMCAGAMTKILTGNCQTATMEECDNSFITMEGDYKTKCGRVGNNCLATGPEC
mmetsp:Transcript_66810/g.118285  ORF Transcript_66810/g.118285 Transcript_66810/m.118285 type:complete len:111 (+) Transcript_66810:66-398(+)|eukprot:CAMPEP_0197654066 /NCGR_PEP_ID=MMETSP1338-20131121/38586_1 /TAXON_ID=43686 ORGANISM="Pelagodinium beii, Strain RCC1491" /NCGR_SAMPLE_ID=MMETSP1338 /ASSEMBLY_ACC=CAM_ASM_000754 /LENGTH=110 /DNA_ID=CAMNT_0043229441 /DNA_START=56 /DNA_END=388 /DNA_ORIENTATION=+